MRSFCAQRGPEELQDASKKLRRGASESVAEALRLCLRALSGQEELASIALALPPGPKSARNRGVLGAARCFSQRGEAANAGLTGRMRELRVLNHWQEHLKRLCDTSWCLEASDFIASKGTSLRAHIYTISLLYIYIHIYIYIKTI